VGEVDGCDPGLAAIPTAMATMNAAHAQPSFKTLFIGPPYGQNVAGAKPSTGEFHIAAEWFGQRSRSSG
jgi:hypothetical protein